MSKIVFPLMLVAFNVQVCHAGAQIEWNAWSIDQDIEFSLSSYVDGAQRSLINAIESGYDGAFVLSAASGYLGWGQTFTIEQNQYLGSVGLKVSSVPALPGEGEFVVGVFRRGLTSSPTYLQLASVSTDAREYAFRLPDTPVSQFDFSSENIQLIPSDQYLIGIFLGDNFHGSLYAHSAVDIYRHGSTYVGTVPVPVPPVQYSLLLIAALAGSLCRPSRTCLTYS